MKDAKNNLADLKQELLHQIELLRGDFQETVARYQSSVEAELLNLITSLSSNAEDEPQAANIDEAKLSFLIELIDSNRQKKDKGRFKDMRRFHEIVKMLSERLDR